MTTSVLYTPLKAENVGSIKNVIPIQSEDTWVTPETAASWLRLHNYEHQRPIRSSNVEFLAEEMRRGEFRQGVQIHFARWEGRLHLVNGQHTLSAIVKSGIRQAMSVCYTDEDPAQVYGRHDIQKKRTTADMFSALQTADEFGFTASQLNRMGAALRFIHEGFSKQTQKMHPRELLSLVEQYADAGIAYFDEILGADQYIRSPLTRTATLSVALVTYRFSAAKYGGSVVSDFWKGIAFDDSVARGDPRKTAKRHLETINMQGSNGDATAKIKKSAAYSSRYVAQCFNAFVENRNLGKTYVMDEATRPIIINGTPWDGKTA